MIGYELVEKTHNEDTDRSGFIGSIQKSDTGRYY